MDKTTEVKIKQTSEIEKALNTLRVAVSKLDAEIKDRQAKKDAILTQLGEVGFATVGEGVSLKKTAPKKSDLDIVNGMKRWTWDSHASWWTDKERVAMLNAAVDSGRNKDTFLKEKKNFPSGTFNRWATKLKNIRKASDGVHYEIGTNPTWVAQPSRYAGRW